VEHPVCSVRANPGTFEQEKFAEFNDIGINRLSLGIQSFDDNHLKALGRVHGAKESLQAAFKARDAGFDNIRSVPGHRGVTESYFLLSANA